LKEEKKIEYIYVLRFEEWSSSPEGDVTSTWTVIGHFGRVGISNFLLYLKFSEVIVDWQRVLFDKLSYHIMLCITMLL